MTSILKSKWALVAVCAAILVTALFLIQSERSFGRVTSDLSVPTARSTSYTFFATSTNQDSSGIYSTTTHATSTNITSYFDSDGRLDNGAFSIEGASRVLLTCERGDKQGGGNTGSTLCRYQVSNDLTNWEYFERLSNATSTGSLVPGAITATSSIHAAMDLQYATWKYLRCTVKEVTDGSHECRAIATWE